MNEIRESQLNNLREAVTCNLCGKDKCKLLYRLNSQALQLKTLWLDGIEYSIHSQESIVRCTVCGLIYVNPRLAAHSNIENYSDELETLYFTNTREQRKRAFTHVINMLPQWLERPPQTLLDIGCGDGLLLEIGQSAGIECFGTEQRQSLCRQVRAQLGEKAIVSQDVSKLDAASYDVVTLLNVIEHLRQPKEMLTEIHRLLKPDGLLLVHAPNMGGIPARIRGKRWNQIEPFEHFYYFNTQTLTAMLSDAGFDTTGRFSLFTSSGLKDRVQRLLSHNHIYIDNGLGIVSRRRSESFG